VAEDGPDANLTIDSTEDMRPGLGLDGVAHLRDFVEKGGLLIARKTQRNLRSMRVGARGVCESCR